MIPLHFYVREVVAILIHLLVSETLKFTDLL